MTLEHKASTAEKRLHSSLDENLRQLSEAVGRSNDIVIRKIQIGEEPEIRIAVCYTDGLASEDFIQRDLLKTMMIEAKELLLHWEEEENNLVQRLKNRIVTLAEVSNKNVIKFEPMLTSILSGDTIILIDGYNEAIEVDTREWAGRSVSEPMTETVIRGPHESFTETLRTNTALIRRKIRDANLWIESRQIGERSKTDVSIIHLHGVANDKIVTEVRERLDKINIDAILESGNIEELIQDEVYTPFPTIFNSERPDVIAAGLLEGKVAIVVDGTPAVLLVPALFVQFLQSPEDYYHRSDFGLLRLLRYGALFLSLFAPSMYIAVTTFHQEMIPTPLLISLAAQREGIPFPAFIEALMMEVTFEILREAGVRMPRVIGPTISIVGALVLGDAAVKAGLVSPAMVIIVSITAISGLIFPSFSIGIPFRMLRFVFMAFAASFGLFGIFIGFLALILHLCSLRSFGVPYMSPLAPMNIADQQDAVFRFPVWMNRKRSQLISENNNIRNRTPKPEPPKNR